MHRIGAQHSPRASPAFIQQDDLRGWCITRFHFPFHFHHGKKIYYKKEEERTKDRKEAGSEAPAGEEEDKENEENRPREGEAL